MQQQHQQPIERKNIELPEDLGKRSASLLLQEIYAGGCIDTSAQSFALLMMCLTPEDVSRIRLGQLSKYTIMSLRLYKEAFGVEFKLRLDDSESDGGSDDESDDGFGAKRGDGQTIICSCLGIGYRNMARAST
jgi:RNA 3'-terminal phosphate cyclase-like protein